MKPASDPNFLDIYLKILEEYKSKCVVHNFNNFKVFQHNRKLSTFKTFEILKNTKFRQEHSTWENLLSLRVLYAIKNYFRVMYVC